MNRFTDLALDKNAVDFQDLFQEVLSQKVSDALDAKKVEIAATMFEDPAIAEEKIEMTRGGRATGAAISDIIAKNNARLAKKKADAAKQLRKKEKYDGGVKEEVELEEGMVDHISKVHVHGSHVTLHMDNGKKSTQKHPSPEAALKDGKAWHKATGREAKLVVGQAIKEEAKKDHVKQIANSLAATHPKFKVSSFEGDHGTKSYVVHHKDDTSNFKHGEPLDGPHIVLQHNPSTKKVEMDLQGNYHFDDNEAHHSLDHAHAAAHKMFKPAVDLIHKTDPVKNT